VEAAALLHVRGRKSTELVFVRCMAKGLFAGLWEPPRIPARNRHAARASLEAMLGADVSLDEQPVRRVEHVLSHRKLDVTVWEGTIARRPRAIGPLHRDRYDEVEVVTRKKLDVRGVSTLARRVLGE
jgi:adenine-specific DNA glycosylase